MPSWPAQGLRFSGLQHPPSENANFALASKSSKSIEDSSKKLDFPSCNKIAISVVDDTPSARMTFLQLSTPRFCKIRSLGNYSALRDTAALPGSSLEVVTFEHGTCQVGASNLSRSSLDLVKFKPGTFQVRAWDLRGSSLGPGDLEPGNRQVQAVSLPKSQPGSCQVLAANLSPARRTRGQPERP